MRVLAATLILLLAGCSSPAEPVPEQPTGPLHEDPNGQLPDAVSISASDDMDGGVDKTWDWSLDPRVMALDVHVDVGGMSGAPAQVQNEIIIEMFHNGTMFQSGGRSGMFISGGGGPVALFTFSDRATNGTLTDLAGDWSLRIRSGPNLAAYSLTVSGVYA